MNLPAPLPRSPRRPRSRRRSADGPPRPQRGDVLELQIESLAFGGEGVARLGEGGYVVFVAGAIPGDRVRAVVHKRKRSYAHARTLEVLEPGPERIAPLADHPGVPWQVLPYERQLEVKRAQVDDALRRIGRLDGFSSRTSWLRSSRGGIATSSSTPSASTGRGRRAARVRLSRSRRRKPGGADRRLPAGLTARQPRTGGGAALVPRAGAHRLGPRRRRPWRGGGATRRAHGGGG